MSSACGLMFTTKFKKSTKVLSSKNVQSSHHVPFVLSYRWYFSAGTVSHHALLHVPVVYVSKPMQWFYQRSHTYSAVDRHAIIQQLPWAESMINVGVNRK